MSNAKKKKKNDHFFKEKSYLIKKFSPSQTCLLHLAA